jgi:hypothetical protein
MPVQILPFHGLADLPGTVALAIIEEGGGNGR